MFVVTADHGEAFGEHGTYEHHGGAFGQHGEQEYNSYLYEENVHVPLVVANAAQTGTIDRPLSLQSLKDLLDVSDEGVAIDTDQTDDVVMAQNMSADQMALRTRRWKYIHEEQNGTLYDLTNNEHDSVDDVELLDCFERLVDARRQAHTRRQRIVDAARGLDISGRT
jgi:arylsulfatase